MTDYCDKCKESRKYNGWTNYETWLVALWLDNEQASSEAVTKLANSKTEYECQKWDTLKADVEEIIGLDEASLRADLINGALSEVNWQEIIESHKEMAK